MLLVLLVLTVAIARQYPDEKKERRAEALAEFLAWADPATEECGSPEKIKVVRRWPGFLRVRYQRPCDPPASFDALLEIREGAGVWQVRGGYVASRRVIDRALALAGGPDLEEASGADDFPWPSADDERVAGPPSTVSPPPDNLESDASSAAAILPARALHREDPVVPVEAGRARLFSPVRVEILVDVRSKQALAVRAGGDGGRKGPLLRRLQCRVRGAPPRIARLDPSRPVPLRCRDLG
jgi:hypothetical protein